MCACSVITEFLQILTDQANAASSEGGKNTITEAHVVKALKDLEFKHLAAQVEDLAQPAAKAPPRKKNKMKDSGLSQEELLRMQQELFAESKQKMGASGSASGEDLLPRDGDASDAQCHAVLTERIHMLHDVGSRG